MAKQLNVDMRFRADTSQAKKAIDDLNASLSKLAYGSMPQNSAINPATFEAAAKSARELTYHLNQAYNIKTGNLDLNRLNSSLKSTGTSLKELVADFGNAGPVGQQAFLALSKAIASADQPAISLNTHLSSLWTTLKNVARFQLSSSIIHGLMGGLQSAYGYAKDLNQSLNNIRIVTGDSTEKMARFAREANTAAKALSATTLDYTNASLIYYQQGLNDAAVKARTDVTVKLANVSRQSAEEVSNQMTAIWENFDNGAHSMEYFADVITALGATTASSSEEIATGLEKFAPIAGTIGLSYEKATAALAAIIANTRQSAETVGTGLRTIFSRFESLKLGETLEDGVDLNKYTKAMQTIGVNVLDANGKLRDMDSILDDIAANWEKLDNTQKTAFATTVGGVRQYTNLMALFESWDDVQRNMMTASGAEGTLQEQADIYAESWEAAQKQVKTSLQGLWDTLINDKFFINLNNNIAEIISGIDKFIERFGGIKSIALSVGAIILGLVSNKIEPAIRKVIADIQIMTGGANKVYSRMQAEFSEATENQIKTGNYDEVGKAELEGNNQILLAKTKLGMINEKLSAQERMNAEMAISGFEIQANKLKELAEAQIKLAQAAEEASNKKQEAENRLNIVLAEELEKQQQLLDAEKARKENNVNKAQEIRDNRNIELQTANADVISAQKSLRLSTKQQNYSISGQLASVSSGLDKLKLEPTELENIRNALSSFSNEVISTANNVRTSFVDAIINGNTNINNLGQTISNNLIPKIREIKSDNLQEVAAKLNLVQNSFKTFINSSNNKEGINKAFEAFSNAAKSGNLDEAKKAIQSIHQEMSKATQTSKDFEKIAKSLGLNPAKLIAYKNALQQQEKATQNLTKAEQALKTAEQELKIAEEEAKQLDEENLKDTPRLIAAREAVAKATQDVAKANQQAADKTAEYEQAQQKLKQTVEDFKPQHTITPLEGLTKGIAGLGQTAMVINSLKSAITTLNDSDASFIEKLTSSFMTISMVIPGAISAFNSFKAAVAGGQAALTLFNTLLDLNNNKIITSEGVNIGAAIAHRMSQGETYKEALAHIMNSGAIDKETLSHLKGIPAKLAAAAANGTLTASLAALLGPILAVVAAIGLIVAAFIAWKNSTPEAQLKKANEELKNAEEAAKNAKQAYEDLKNTISDYQEGIDKISEMDNSMEDFTKSIEEANEQARNLIKTLGLLPSDWRFGDNGEIIINDEALEKGQQQARQRYESSLVSGYVAQTHVNDAQNQVDRQRILKDIFGNDVTTLGTAAQGLSEILSQANITELKDQTITLKTEINGKTIEERLSDLGIYDTLSVENLLTRINNDASWTKLLDVERILNTDLNNSAFATAVNGIINDSNIYQKSQEYGFAGEALSSLEKIEESTLQNIYDEAIKPLQGKSLKELQDLYLESNGYDNENYELDKKTGNVTDKEGNIVASGLNSVSNIIELIGKAAQTNYGEKVVEARADVLNKTYEAYLKRGLTEQQAKAQTTKNYSNLTYDELVDLREKLQGLGLLVTNELTNAIENYSPPPLDISNVQNSYENLQSIVDKIKFGDILSPEEFDNLKTELGDSVEEYFVTTETGQKRLITNAEIFKEIVENTFLSNLNETHNENQGQWERSTEGQDYGERNLTQEANYLGKRLQSENDFWNVSNPEEQQRLENEVQAFTESILGQRENYNNLPLEERISLLKEALKVEQEYQNAVATSSDSIFELNNNTKESNLNTDAYKEGLKNLAAQLGEKGEAALKKYNETIETYGENSEQAATATKQLAKELRQIEVDKAADNIRKLLEEDFDDNNIHKIGNELRNIFGENVTDEFIKNNKGLVEQYVNGSDEVRQAAANTMVAVFTAFDDPDFTSAAQEQLSGLGISFGSLQTIFANGLHFTADGQVDFSQVLAQLALVTGDAETAAQLVASFAASSFNMDPSALMGAITSVGEFPTKTEEIPAWSANVAAALGNVVAAQGTVPADVKPNLTNTSGKKGGGGGGGSSAKTHTRKERDNNDRYKPILAKQDDKKREIDAAKDRVDRLAGKARIDNLREENKLLGDNIELQKEYINEITNYLAQDKDDMVNALAGFGLTIDFDPNGVINNYDAIMDKLYAIYNQKADQAMDEDAWKKFEDSWQNAIDAVNQYIETRDLEEEQQQNLTDMLNEQFDQLLEMVNTELELNIQVNDADLDLLDHLINKIDDDAYKAAEAIALMGDKAARELERANYYQNAINQTLSAYGLESVDDLLNMSPEDLQNLGITQETVDNMVDWNGELLSITETLDDMQKEIREKVIDSFDELNEKVQDSYDFFNHYNTVLESYRNIADLNTAAIGKESRALIRSLDNSMLRNSQNALRSSKAMYDKLVEDRQIAQQKLDDAVANGLMGEADGYRDLLEDIDEQIRDAQEQWLADWEDGLEKAQEILERAVDDAVKNYEELLAPLYGSLDALNDVYEMRKEVDSDYVQDYEKLYQLNKLNRDLNKTLNEVQGVQNRKQLLALQEKINKLQKDGTKMSEYDLEVLEKEFEVQQARIALEEAANAKSTVRLQRDNEGNWGYVYTADSETIEEAQQNYEDKLYEYQKLNNEYIREMEDQLMDLSQTAKDRIAEVWADSTLSPEEKQAKTDEIVMWFNAQRDFISSQMENALQNQQNLTQRFYDTYQNTYAEVMDTYEETMLAEATKINNLNEWLGILSTGFENLLDEVKVANEEYLAHIQETDEAAGSSIQELATDITAAEAEIDEASLENVETINQLAQAVQDGLVASLDSAIEQEAKLAAEIASTTEQIEKQVQAWNNVMRVLNDVGDAAHVANYPLETLARSTEKYGLSQPSYNPEDWEANEAISAQFDNVYNQDYWQEEHKMADELDSAIQEWMNLLSMQALTAMGGFGTLTQPYYQETEDGTLQQEVHIEANFPGVTDRSQIEEAFENLVNKAAQFANRKRQG